MRDATPITICERQTIPAAADTVWAVLGDFGTEHRWSRQLAACDRDHATVTVGTVRSCRLARPLLGRRQVAEQLTDYQPGSTLAYQLRGSAGAFRSAEGRWTLRAAQGGTVVEVSGRFQPRSPLVGLVLGPLARRTAVRAARRALADLTAFVLDHG